MNRFFPFCMVAVVILFFQGCASKQVSPPLSERVPQSAGAGERGQSGLTDGSQKGRGGAITEEDLSKSDEARRRAAEEAAKAGRFKDIFFEFDNYTVRSEDTPVLQGVAALLNANPAARLTIEGYCDERGTIEYNLALGQKRAEAARDYLVRLGVSDKRIKTISYGKEAPLQPGHSEADWSKNRRAHFVMQ
jgi:peptidoglycan-associated lipoprotein